MNLKKRSLFLLIAGLGLLFILAAPVLAQEPDIDRVNEIARKLSCPTCAGLNLADCPTLTCQQWREQIGDLVVEGYTDQEVLDYFSARYGNQVLQEPPRSGSTLILWVLPVLAVVVGVGLLGFTIRNWSRREPVAEEQLQVDAPGAPAAGYVPDAYLEQVEQDLEREDK
jgi:cytochrome c-type biogenesis protein CcmH